MSSRMRLVFCGTPQFSVPTLKALLGSPDFEVAAVITQPDRPQGRGNAVTFPAVKEAALSCGVEVYQPEKIRSPEAEKFLTDVAPDCIAIIAYGQIIPARLLTIPRFGWINVHASLLPKYRGAAPANWAIVNGESVSGVTSMRIDAGMDTGDTLLRAEIRIGRDETAPELLARMSEAGAPLLLDTLRGLRDGTLAAQPQDSSQASSAPLMKKEDGRIDWTLRATEIYNRMRGFTPWPGAFTTFRGQSCAVWGTPVSNEASAAAKGAPATLLVDGSNLEVICGHATVLRVGTVKLEGRKQVSAAEFVHGARLIPAELFGIR